MQKYHTSDKWKRLIRCAKGRYCRDFWNYTEVAAYYSISRSTLYKIGKRERWEEKRYAWWCELMKKHTVKGALEYRAKKQSKKQWLHDRKERRILRENF